MLKLFVLVDDWAIAISWQMELASVSCCAVGFLMEVVVLRAAELQVRVTNSSSTAKRESSGGDGEGRLVVCG